MTSVLCDRVHRVLFWIGSSAISGDAMSLTWISIVVCECGSVRVSFRVSGSWCVTSGTCLFLLQTTIMAVEYDGGVILGADSRTTTGESIELVLNCRASISLRDSIMKVDYV